MFIKENKMISFTTVKDHLRILGIFDVLSPESLVYRIINIGYKAVVSILLILLIGSNGWFMMFEVQTFADFAKMVPIMAAGIIVLASYTSFHYNKLKIVQLFNDLNGLVQSSECKSLKSK